MLVLSRKSTESIRIGDSIVVTVLEVRGGKVPIAIDAPKHIHVIRSELQDVILDQRGGVVASEETSR